MRDHGEGRSVVAVGQVDDVGDGREHRALAAGANGSTLLTHRQEQLKRVERDKEEKPRTFAWHLGCRDPR